MATCKSIVQKKNTPMLVGLVSLFNSGFRVDSMEHSRSSVAYMGLNTFYSKGHLAYGVLVPSNRFQPP